LLQEELFTFFPPTCSMIRQAVKRASRTQTTCTLKLCVTPTLSQGSTKDLCGTTDTTGFHNHFVFPQLSGKKKNKENVNHIIPILQLLSVHLM